MPSSGKTAAEPYPSYPILGEQNQLLNINATPATILKVGKHLAANFISSFVTQMTCT
jgi:hypothetical protein